MKYIFVIIGLVFVLGGFHAVTDPRSFVASNGGSPRSGSPAGTFTFGPEAATLFGYISIGAGIVIVLASFTGGWLTAKINRHAERHPVRFAVDLNAGANNKPAPKPMARPQSSGVKIARGYPPIKRDS